MSVSLVLLVGKRIGTTRQIYLRAGRVSSMPHNSYSGRGACYGTIAVTLWLHSLAVKCKIAMCAWDMHLHFSQGTASMAGWLHHSATALATCSVAKAVAASQVPTAACRAGIPSAATGHMAHDSSACKVNICYCCLFAENSISACSLTQSWCTNYAASANVVRIEGGL